MAVAGIAADALLTAPACSKAAVLAGDMGAAVGRADVGSCTPDAACGAAAVDVVDAAGVVACANACIKAADPGWAASICKGWPGS